MEKVANDGKGAWHYDATCNVYWFIDERGNKAGKIFPQYLPNPVVLWKSKLEREGLTMQDDGAKYLKPNDVVFQLWEHKEAACPR